MNDNTDMKCLGCKRDLPTKGYDPNDSNTVYYARYNVSEIVEWICSDCWESGLRYTNWEEIKYVK
jgi:hypothetical protein